MNLSNNIIKRNKYLTLHFYRTRDVVLYIICRMAFQILTKIDNIVHAILADDDYGIVVTMK